MSTDSAPTCMGLSREAELILLACRPEFSPADELELNQLASSPIDVPEMRRLARFHQLEGILWRRLGPSLLPAELASDFEAVHRLNRQRHFTLTQELIAVSRLLNQAGIPVMALKGPLQAREIYDDTGMRWIADVDLLIRREDLTRTAKLMSHHDYQLQEDEGQLREPRFLDRECEVSFLNPQSRLSVEIHWQLMPSHSRLGYPISRLWETAEESCVAQLGLLRPEWRHNLLYLCIHGGEKHQWANLRFLNDIIRMLTLHHDADWGDFMKWSRELGCLDPLLLAVALCRDLLGYPPAEVLTQAIEAKTNIRDRVALVRGRLFRHGNGLPGYREWHAYREATPAASPDRPPLPLWLRYIAAILRPEFNDRESSPATSDSLGLLHYIVRPLRLIQTHSSGLVRRLR